MDENKSNNDQFPPVSPDYTPSHLPFFVVGIGASAGGIEALQRFFDAMPEDNGMAFVIVLHLSPQHESNLAAILQAHTSMPVIPVTQTVAIEPNHVYVISPDRNLVMADGCLQTTELVRPYGRHVAIDEFLRSLAEVHRDRAIGIILSGADSDGAVGVARLKETGGLAIAQLPEDAEHDAMPRRAIESGMIDWVLPVSDMPQKVLELVRNALVMQIPPIDQADAGPVVKDKAIPINQTESVLHDILSILQRYTRHSFHHYKRATVLRRLERRLQANCLPDLPAYRRYLEEHVDEIPRLLEDMLIGVTNFFRDGKAFGVLERDILPRIFEQTSSAEPIRVWSVGCATGEEPYSIAMLLAEKNAPGSTPRAIQVFASDIDEHAINTARNGLYPKSIEVDVLPSRLRQHFTKEEKHYRIKREIREMATFAVHNILHDPPFSKMNLVVCRNLLIYLNRDIQRKVFEILHYALYPYGYLFLGNAETADEASEFFTPISRKHRIYQALPGRPSFVPTLPEPTARARLQKAAPLVNYKSQSPTAPVVSSSWHLLEEFDLPGVILNDEDEIVYATTRGGAFLHYPSGEPTRSILAVIHPALRLELQTTLFQAKQSRRNVMTQYIPLPDYCDNATVRILVQPGQADRHGRFSILLLFEEAKKIDPVSVSPNSEANSVLVSHLHAELQDTKEQLQSVINQYAIALQEARSAQEEMQSINEELRSATEELETSKEELQSINEELTTVNADLKIKLEETAKTHDDLENFVTATGIATIFIDRFMRIRSYTKTSTKLFNLIASDVGRPLAHITHHLDYPEMKADIECVFDQLQPIEREVHNRQGQWYIARLLPYRTGDDRIAGIVLSFIDISMRKAAEEKLQQSEQRMRLVAATTKDYAIATLDNEGVVTSWNAGAARLFGYTEQEMVGRSAIVLYQPEEQAKRVLQKELRQAQRTGRAEDERWHVRKDGTLVYCSGITSLLSEEAIHGYVKICRDMTGSKWMQDQQAAKLEWERRERIRAEEAARLRDEFFAVLSHELKQPLNLIQLTAEMMSRMPEAGTQPVIARGTSTIKHMVESQARIIDDLMDLSRLHTGKLTLNRAEINFGEAVSRVVSLMMDEAQRCRITLIHEPAVEDVMVYGDAVRLEQVVWNLLSNALKFTPSGGKIWIRLRQEGTAVCLEVADTGKGIGPEFLPHIFDMFRQGDTGTTRQYGGMGIGLALVKQLVHSHGGRVETHSAGVGQGAQFQVFLPFTAARENDAPSAAPDQADLSGKRILLVDDTVQILESLAELLVIEQAQVATASNGADAIKCAQEASEPYDLIISDIGMPGMDGYMLLAELRKITATATTPAIALTGFARPRDIERALQAGYQVHVCKPVVFDQLIALAVKTSQETKPS
jgi:two-component system CheB/CheR fusion protein